MAHESTGRPPVDVRDMIVVHAAMVREFRLAPAAVNRTRAGDLRRARSVGRHLQFLCDLLHHHHAGEDELLWPKLRARTSTEVLGAIEEVESQHRELDASLSRVGQARSAWMDDPGPEQRGRLADELETLSVHLEQHLDLEERALLPVAARVLTEEEWHAIGQAGVVAMPRSAMPLAFGMFAYAGDPEVLTEMLRQAPPVPRKVLPVIAPRIYARRSRLVHGTSRP